MLPRSVDDAFLLLTLDVVNMNAWYSINALNKILVVEDACTDCPDRARDGVKAGVAPTSARVPLERARERSRVRLPHRKAACVRAQATGAASPDRLGVVITGGTSGIGFYLAREMLSAGHSVVIASRDERRVRGAGGYLAREFGGGRVHATVADVARPADVDALAAFARERLGVVHHWVNGAGKVTAIRPLHELGAEEIVAACNANLLGALLCTRAAIGLMASQPQPGAAASDAGGAPAYQIWNFGFSKYGASFSRSAATHKATKVGLSQLTASANEELRAAGLAHVAVRQLSPGLVLTDLLLGEDGASPVARRIFNALAEEPEEVAAFLCPRMLDRAGGRGPVEFLTLQEAVGRMATGLPQILGGGRHFDAEGRRVRAPGVKCKANGVRLLPYEDEEAGVAAASR